MSVDSREMSMKEGKGAYGTVFSSPRLPLLHETLEEIQSRDEVSKVFYSYRGYYNEVTRYTILHSNYDFPHNLFSYPIDHGRISKREIQDHEIVYNEEWSNGDDVYREATHQIIYPRCRSIFTLHDLDKYIICFEKIIQTVEFFTQHQLVFDDFKNQNLLLLGGEDCMIVSDYSSIVSLDDFIEPSIFYKSNFKSRYYYIHSPILNTLLCQMIRNEETYSNDASIEKSYISYFHHIVFSAIPSDFVYRQSYYVDMNHKEVIHVELSGEDLKDILLEFFGRPLPISIQKEICIQKERNHQRLSSIVSLFRQHYDDSQLPLRIKRIGEIVERSHIHSMGIMLMEAMCKMKELSKDVLHVAIYCCLQYVDWKGKPILLFPRLEKIREYYDKYL